MFRNALRIASDLLSPMARDRATRPARRMQSWVVLCERPVDLQAETLRQALDRAFPGHFLPARDDGSFVVGGPSPEPMMIKSLVPGASGLFMPMAVDGPSTDGRTVAARNPYLAQLIEMHRAWMSIDCVNAFDGSNLRLHRPRAGRARAAGCACPHPSDVAGRDTAR